MAGAERADFHVIVTRPEPAASRTQARLAAIDIDATIVSLTEIVPLSVDGAPLFYDMVVATSVNAVLSASSDLLERLKSLPAFAVGQATEKALYMAGFQKVMTQGPDAEALARFIQASIGSGSSIAYLCGRERREAVEAVLSPDHQLTVLETYHAPMRGTAFDELHAVLAKKKVSHVLVYSRRASDALAAVFTAQQSDNTISKPIFLCLSSEVAEPLRASGFTVSVAQFPNEAHLIELLGIEKRS